MIIENVMDQIGDRLDTIPDLRVTPYEADDIEVPAALVSLPGNIDYLGAYKNGMHVIQILVTILVATTDDRIRRKEIAPYGDGSGSRSIKQVLETGFYTAFDVITVKSCSFGVITIEEIDYLGALLPCEVAGPGN